MTDAPSWDLSDLYASPDDPTLMATLEQVQADAEAFAQRYQGKLATLDATALADALTVYEQLLQTSGKPQAYAGLRFAADAAPENGAFVQKIRERATQATLPLLFFPIELGRVDGKQLEALAEDPALSNYRRYLHDLRQTAIHNLSEPEERILAEKANTGSRAWVRLSQEVLTKATFTLDGKTLNLSEVSDLQMSPDRALRERSAAAMTEGLKAQEHILTYIYNTLLQDKAVGDRLRGYAYPEEDRHLSNELTPEIVAAVTDAAERSYSLVGRFYRVKQRLLGLPTLMHYDRYAPLTEGDELIDFADARERILTAFGRFHGEFAAAGKAFFTNDWIDAAPRAGKQGGAFCSYVTPDLHPYLFQTYYGKPNDLKTLAHELGHGIHASFSRQQTYLNFHGTLPMAEVASTFAELLLFEQERSSLSGAGLQALYSHTIEQAFSTVHRQTAMYRFEQAAHQERQKGEVSAARFGALWQEKIGAMFDGAVTLGEGHACWWSYIPHFIVAPFYVYAYTFGEMLALALYHRYKQEGGAFADRYVNMLRSGGALTPAELVAPLGVDLADPTFWDGAIALLADWVTEFEKIVSSGS